MLFLREENSWDSARFYKIQRIWFRIKLLNQISKTIQLLIETFCLKIQIKIKIKIWILTKIKIRNKISHSLMTYQSHSSKNWTKILNNNIQAFKMIVELSQNMWLNITQMDQDMKALNQMVWDMVRENSIIKMVVYMMEDGRQIKCMDKEPYIILLDSQHTRETGLRINFKDMELFTMRDLCS